MNAPPILLALGQIEARGNAAPVVSHDFTVSGPWLLRADQVPRLLATTTIPGLQFKHRLSAFAGRKTQITLPVAAPAIQLKADMTRARAFTPHDTANPTGTSTKVVSTAAPIALHTRNEMRVRAQVAALGTIAVPRIIDSGNNDAFLWVREELLRGRRFSLWRDTGLYIRQGLTQLSATYKAHGLTAAPLRNFFSASLPEDIASLAALRPMLRDISQHLERAWQSNPQTPVSLCHGDLLPSNLAVSAGQLYFLDWELATENAVISDLLRLPLKNTLATRTLLAPTLDHLRDKLGVAPAVIQQHLCAYLCNRIVQRPEHAPQLLAIWARYARV